MKSITITRKSSDVQLSPEVRREADRGPIVTRDGYTVLDHDTWDELAHAVALGDALHAAITAFETGRYGAVEGGPIAAIGPLVSGHQTDRRRGSEGVLAVVRSFGPLQEEFPEIPRQMPEPFDL